jgi:hypothetical protein
MREFRAGERAELPDAPKTAMQRVSAGLKQGAAAPFEMVGGMRRALQGKVLGARQFAVEAGISGEDEEKLRQQAMELESANKQATPSGKAGDFIGSIAPEMMVGGPVGRAVAAGIKQLPRLVRGIAGYGGASAGGAASSMLTPETGEYDIADKAKSGAMWGAGGRTAGHVASAVYRPIRSLGGVDAQENAALLNRSGLPNQFPATQTDSKMIQAATNALEQIDFTGTTSRLRNQNYEWGTRKFTKPTGTEVSVLSQSARDKMKNALTAEARRFDAVPGKSAAPVPPADLEEAERAVRKFASHPGTEVKMKGAPSLWEVSVEDLMHLRSAATKLSHSKSTGATPSPELAKDFRTLREMYDDAIRGRLPDRQSGLPGPTKQDYTEWLDKWGAEQVVEQAFAKGTSGGRLLPKNIEAVVGDTFASGDPAKRLASAMAENMPTPPAGWNRAAITAAILGGMPAVGAASDLYRNGEVGPLTGLGLGTSATLIAGLLRKAPSAAQSDELRRKITAFMLAAGNNQ